MTTPAAPPRATPLTWCEALAADGASAGAPLTAADRIELARRHAALLGADAFPRLVVAIGHPAASRDEAAIVRAVADAVTECQLLVGSHADRADALAALDAVATARGGRLRLAVPASDAEAARHGAASAAVALDHARRLVGTLRERGTTTAIEVALHDVLRGDAARLADAAATLAEAGAHAVILADAPGAGAPRPMARLCATVRASLPHGTALGVAADDTLGLALATTLECAAAGARYVTTAWMGRAGDGRLAATERLLAALAAAPNAWREWFGLDAAPWAVAPDRAAVDAWLRQLATRVGLPDAVPAADASRADAPDSGAPAPRPAAAPDAWARARDAAEVRAADLPPSRALPLHVLRAAARVLPATLARVDGDEVVLTRRAADAYLRVVSTDFSREVWAFDDPADAETVAIWLGLGGSFIADYGDRPADPRIFAWMICPVAEAAHFAMKELKGRDGRWVPTSVNAPPALLPELVDATRCAFNLAAFDAVLDVGPIGVRFPARRGVVPTYFMHRALEGLTVQIAFPGRAPAWMRWFALLEQLTGHRFLGGTSANFSEQGREVVATGTHKDLAELQAHMGWLGVPLLSGPISLDGRDVPVAERRAAYKRLNAPAEALSPGEREHTRAVLPNSLSLVGITEDPARWILHRHGSVHEARIREALAPFGIALEHQAGERLEIGRYVGDLLAGFPPFAGLGAREIAEIAQLLEHRTFAAGEVIVRQGDLADRMYFIGSGSVTVDRDPPVVLAAGDHFGEIALVEDARRSATVVGREPGLLLVLTGHVLLRMMEEFPTVGAPIRQAARERLG